ncbi:MAG: hypothetical protein ACRYGM_29140 [Janthinobacterium lividum]
MLLLLASPAAAKDLLVGPGQPYDRPSAAIRAAQPGDQVLIEPGEYYDCASWTTPGLTVAGRGPGAVMTDRTCQDKAILVIGGERTTLRNLTLARARVPDGNGAGVRLEAPGLILDRVTFRDDQVGLLSGPASGAILATECRFEGGGVGGDHPMPAVLVGASDQLLLRGSVFTDLKGSAVSSSAADTTLVSNSFSGIGVLPAVSAEGRLTLVGNRFEIGAGATGQPGAVLANGPVGPTLRGNRLLAARPMALLLDWSGGSPVLDGNQVGLADSEVSTSGSWRNKASGAAHEIKDGLRSLASRAKRLVLGQ